MQGQCHYASNSLTNLAEFLDYQCCDKEAHENRKDRPRKASHEEQVTDADSVTDNIQMKNMEKKYGNN